jgi:hypothetical protein
MPDAEAGAPPPEGEPPRWGAAARRSPAAWRLAWRALLLVLRVRIALWRRPYGRVRADLRARGAAAARPAAPVLVGGRDLARDPDALAWAVAAAARRVPQASCLTQALALEALLDAAGCRSDLRIGVARRADGSFEAHAWTEVEGRILNGALPGMERFGLLPAGAEPPAGARSG